MSVWEKLVRRRKSPFDPERSDGVLMANRDCEPEPDDVGFTAAVVGLGAKMAKADGRVTGDELAVFLRVFQARPEDTNSVRRVFNLARQTVRGYQSYAHQIGQKYRNQPCLLEGVLDGLFMIAAADGVITGDELVYLETVARAFGFSDADFERIKAVYIKPGEACDPYAVLGVSPDTPFGEIRHIYRKRMADHHPDRLVHKGAPREFEQAAHDKATAITSAYARIKAERGAIMMD